ncbi:beta-propeller fold lactonase family protein [Castellaniella sp. FW104-16D08]|uniref:YncE family protein n=1 Tax=unclassified Castellaniella TaxID=2617606 RepID=UPI003314FD7F
MLKIRPLFVSIALALAAGALQAATLPNGVVYSANEGDGSVSEITLRTGAVRTAKVSVIPHNVQISPDGKTVLAVGMPAMTGMAGHGMGNNQADKKTDAHASSENGNGAKLLLIDASQIDKTLATLPSGGHPAHVVTSEKGDRAYITNSEANQVSVVDIQQKKIIAEIPTGDFPHGLRLSPNGQELYIANAIDNSVSVINTQSLKESARIPVGKAPVQVAFTPDGAQVYVSLRDENSVAIIDTATRQMVKRIKVGRNPIQLYTTADGSKVYVANQGSESEPDNTVSVINVKNQSVQDTVITGMGAHGVVASSDGDFVFVTNNKDDTVSAIDTSTQEVVATYRVGPNPNGITYRSIP